MPHPQILIHEMSYNLPTGLTSKLFCELNLTFAKQKISLVGKNGVGKSTLIQLLVGELHPSAGAIQIEGRLAYVQQNPEFSSDLIVAKLLGFEEKLNALSRIEQGSSDPNDFSILNDDWMIKEKLQEQLTMFGLETISPYVKVKCLSGGELTRLLLTKAFSSNADFLLLDEPTNHLDIHARQQLYHAILHWQGGIIVASHDRTLLNLMDEIVEISSLGVATFGGNYDAYKVQKECLIHAKQQQLLTAQRLLQKTKRSIQSTKEKHEQRQAHGRTLRKRRDQPKVLLDAMENRSTASQNALSIRHNRMIDSAHEKIRLAKEQVEVVDRITVSLPKTHIPKGKVILEIKDLIFSYAETRKPLINHFNLTLQGPERIALCGGNGSGKTTLIKLLLASINTQHTLGSKLDDSRLQPDHGNIYLGTARINYLDQNAEQLNSEISILENFLQLNNDAKENDAYQALAQFLFKNVSALKLVKHLSGGEKLRALLACILLSSQPPQLLILDEPTNHLDINSTMSIVSALENYQGAMIVISHDMNFLDSIGIERIIYAPFTSTD